jgi:hypothetical protein
MYTCATVSAVLFSLQPAVICECCAAAPAAYPASRHASQLPVVLAADAVHLLTNLSVCLAIFLWHHANGLQFYEYVVLQHLWPILPAGTPANTVTS